MTEEYESIFKALSLCLYLKSEFTRGDCTSKCWSERYNRILRKSYANEDKASLVAWKFWEGGGRHELKFFKIYFDMSGMDWKKLKRIKQGKSFEEWQWNMTEFERFRHCSGSVSFKKQLIDVVDVFDWRGFAIFADRDIRRK